MRKDKPPEITGGFAGMPFGDISVRRAMYDLGRGVAPFTLTSSAIIGEDTRGRPVALALGYYINRLRTRANMPKIPLWFTTGRSQEPLPNTFLSTLGGSGEVIVASEFLFSGETMAKICTKLIDSGVKNSRIVVAELAEYQDPIDPHDLTASRWLRRFLPYDNVKVPCSTDELRISRAFEALKQAAIGVEAEDDEMFGHRVSQSTEDRLQLRDDARRMGELMLAKLGG